MTLHLPKGWGPVTSRDILPSPRHRPDLRDQNGAIKLTLAANPAMDIDTYLAGKSPILQTILTEADLTPTERAEIFGINTSEPHRRQVS